ncbi:hypothetical protein CN579_20900 [Bacillus toyonensis]|nr:hypothetical protein CN579_20900 [Bacillus toyonensis]
MKKKVYTVRKGRETIHVIYKQKFATKLWFFKVQRIPATIQNCINSMYQMRLFCLFKNFATEPSLVYYVNFCNIRVIFLI